MSEPAAVLPLTPAPLSRIALFDGLGEDDLDALTRAFERLELEPGEVLWRQGAPYRGLSVLVAGETQVCRRLPGDRELELARLEPGEVMGEIALLGGGIHAATVRAVDRCTLLFLSRAEIEARTISGEPGALELRRRIVAVACARLRSTHAALGAPIGLPRPPSESLPGPLPSREYLARLPLFRRLDPSLVTEMLEGAAVLRVPRGHVLPEGCCYVTLNGAVEDVVRRGPMTLRVGFAGPGHAFGYLGLLDGEPASVTSVTRERCVLLALEQELFSALLHGRGARSRAFAAAIEADLVRSLDTAARTRSHLAAARPE